VTEKMKANYKKIVKIVSLIISTLLIASASAATYRYMYIDGSTTVGTALLLWIEGGDAPAGTTISGSTVTVDFNVEPGTPQNFTNCLYLKNQDTVPHNLTISVTQTVSSGDFDEFGIHIYDNDTASWVFVDTLDVTTSDSYETYTGNTPLGNMSYYLMTFEIAANVSASGTHNFDIQVEYE
jgi:hypothetical protein